MSAITHDFRIDWNGDGDYNDTGENVTQRVLDTQRTLTVRYGRDQARSLSPMASGEIGFQLDNTSRDYSPDNLSSPLQPNLIPSRSVRYEATHNAVTYSVFRGTTDQFDLSPQDRSVDCTGVDGLASLKGVTIDTELYHAVTTGEAIGLVLDAAGWPVADRDLDRGATTIRWWWESNVDAFQALERILNSEGPPAMLTVGADGKIVFRDRHHRLTRAASLTSQATFRDGGADPVFSGFTYDHGWRDIVNAVTIDVEDRKPTGDPVEVFVTEQPYTIPSNEEIAITVEASDPFMRAVTPALGTDYALDAGTVQVTLSRTSGRTTTIYVRAVGGNAAITGMRLRAYSVPVVSTFKVEGTNPDSITKYKRRSLPYDAPWVGVHDARALADVILAHRSERMPIVVITLDGGNDDDVLVQQLARDLSDRITIVETETGVNADFFVERIEHTVSDGGGRLVTVFGCEKAPVKPANPFTFGVSGKGFGQGQFDIHGLDDAGSMFRFDTAGQGFNDGRFAT
jgi:hypothetical protein